MKKRVPIIIGASVLGLALAFYLYRRRQSAADKAPATVDSATPGRPQMSLGGVRYGAGYTGGSTLVGSQGWSSPPPPPLPPPVPPGRPPPGPSPQPPPDDHVIGPVIIDPPLPPPPPAPCYGKGCGDYGGDDHVIGPVIIDDPPWIDPPLFLSADPRSGPRPDISAGPVSFGAGASEPPAIASRQPAQMPT